ncbi:hypothetical protein THAOC_31990 [Thalassiosira oceanica]|uniref:Uncharacterized protein n=1 Tax=Thalassiosira oceanica TaxID=159749 RepID=K0RJY9_THAOC|nr:hypothetical protein THAOC_31990 [Thalassiosira oceanica]|eukprot:EJK49161.1 hypothetical protein THAOC_31990 [Thalassiosira oceanica]
MTEHTRRRQRKKIRRRPTPARTQATPTSDTSRARTAIDDELRRLERAGFSDITRLERAGAFDTTAWTAAATPNVTIRYRATNAGITPIVIARYIDDIAIWDTRDIMSHDFTATNNNE